MVSAVGNCYFGTIHLSWQMLAHNENICIFKASVLKHASEESALLLLAASYTKAASRWTNQGTAKRRQLANESLQSGCFSSGATTLTTYLWTQGGRGSCVPWLWQGQFFQKLPKVEPDPMLINPRGSGNTPSLTDTWRMSTEWRPIYSHNAL